jgi:Flp pilus assembly protein TadG
MRWFKRGRSEDGAQLVEFALVLPLLLLVVLGIAEFGFIFQRYEVITNAAREGARLAVLPGYTEPDIRPRVVTYLFNGRVPTTLTNPEVTVDYDVPIPVAGGRPPINATRVTVTYTYTFQFLNALSVFFGSRPAFPLSAVSEMRTEAGS